MANVIGTDHFLHYSLTLMPEEAKKQSSWTSNTIINDSGTIKLLERIIVLDHLIPVEISKYSLGCCSYGSLVAGPAPVAAAMPVLIAAPALSLLVTIRSSVLLRRSASQPPGDP